MTRAQIRYEAHRALAMLEWLDRHVAARMPGQRKALMWTLEDLRKVLLAIAGSSKEPGAGQIKLEDKPDVKAGGGINCS